MTEEIKKLIEEEAEKHIGRNVVFGCAPIETHEGFRKRAFIDGASFILHQNRWRKVEEELPDVKEFGVSDYVLTKCDYESYQVAQYCKNPYYPNGSWFNPDRELSITPVEWKPIS